MKIEGETIAMPSLDGPAPRAEWSNALVLTAGCRSPLPMFECRPGHMRLIPVTWG